MGNSTDWQTDLTEKISSNVIKCLAESLDKARKFQRVVVLNPRRRDWDNSWNLDPLDPRLIAQIEWEHSAIEMSHLVFVNILESSQSPISLQEVGLIYDKSKLIIHLPPKYEFQAILEKYAQHHSIVSHSSFDDSVESLLSSLQNALLCHHE